MNEAGPTPHGFDILRFRVLAVGGLMNLMIDLLSPKMCVFGICCTVGSATKICIFLLVCFWWIDCVIRIGSLTVGLQVLKVTVRAETKQVPPVSPTGSTSKDKAVVSGYKTHKEFYLVDHILTSHGSVIEHLQEQEREMYRMIHSKQAYDFVTRQIEKYGGFNGPEMSIWGAFDLISECVHVDGLDHQYDRLIQRSLRTAEALRKAYPREDWLHLTGLISDLGKVLLHPRFGGNPPWAVVGNTFPVGCAFDERNVHYKFFRKNPDYNNSRYNNELGVYSQGCGLDNVLMSWGHAEYMYLVAKKNGNLPSPALFIIRYHSFNPLLEKGAYKYLMNEEDKENLKWLDAFMSSVQFINYDLYGENKKCIDVEEVKPYYVSLIEKYFPEKLKW